MPEIVRLSKVLWSERDRETAYEADALEADALEADALPTELRRRLSWLGRIKAIQGKGNQSNLT